MLTLLSISMLTLAFNIQMITQASSAPVWLSGWSYRKSHVINPASGAGTKYQIMIKAHYDSGIDSGEDVYLNTHSRTDFGDVRFTDDDGTTELDYWMEEKVNGDYAIFWVEVNKDLSSQSQTIYIYYGKPLATTTSNGAYTFLFFDDCEDLSRWVEDYSSGTPIFEQTTIDGYSGIRLQTNAHEERIYIKSTTTVPRAKAIVSRVKHISFNVDSYHRFRFHLVNSTNYINYHDYESYFDRYQLRKMVGGSHTIVDTCSAAYPYGWYTYEVYDDGTNIDVNRNTTNILDGVISDAALDSDGYLYIMNYQYNEWGTSELAIDRIFVRNYVDPEPTHESWGVEERGEYVKVYVDQFLGYMPGVPVGDSFTVDIVIEVSKVTDYSLEGIVGWGLNFTVDPDVLNITQAIGAASGYFLWNFSDWWWEPYPTLLSSINATEGEAIVSEQIMPTPSGGAGNPWNGLKLVTLEFTSKSETAHSLIDLINVEYMTPDGIWHPVDEVVDGYYNPPPAPDLDIEGIVLPYILVYHPVVYPNPPLGSAYEIRATVTNQGTEDGGSFNISFSVYLNETEVPEYGREKTIFGLAQDMNETVLFDFTPNEYGNYTLIIDADCDNDVVELDETNNVKMTWVIGTIQGDIDGDGDVDWFDFGYFADAYGRTFEQPPYHPADFNYDGAVDWYDFGIFAQNYGQNV